MRRFLALILGVTMLLSLAVPSALATGDTYRILYSGELTTLNYLITGTTNEFAQAANMIDTLVEYDNLGQVKPSLAESWEVSEDGLTWTFHIREGAKWVDNTGAPVADVTAPDFVAAAKYILDAQNASDTASIIYDVVAGAEEYYNGTATPEEGKEAAPVMEWDTVGIKAVDDYTLTYELKQPVPYFLSMTTYVCFMPVYEPFLLEQGENFGVPTSNGAILYCGAYYLSEFQPQEKRTLTKNATNWDADRVYLEEIQYIFNKEASTVSPEMFLRGEVDVSGISSAIAREWLADPVKAEYIRPYRQDGFYSYFYAFDFQPTFDAAYEPDNWLKAANNENFRKAFYYGFDRIKANLINEPENPESITYNTITPPLFVDYGGEDYVSMGALAPITALGLATYDEAKALEYRDAAKKELEAEGVTFPVKALMVYNPNVSDWAEECEVVEQQLEALLGTDFIDFIIEAGPSTGFLTETRRAGKYAFLKCNWGPDYADPQTYTEPFSVDNSYNFMDKGWTQVDENGEKLIDQYYALVDAAMAITGDIEARYLAFAEAEAFLIDHAVIIPFGFGAGGYYAARVNPFESQYAPFGISRDRFKGQHLLDHPMNTDEYYDEFDKWLEERAAIAGK